MTHDIEGNNLSVRLLGLLQLTEVVPESRLGHNVVGRKDPHAAEYQLLILHLESLIHPLELGALIRLGREFTAHNGVLGESAHPACQRPFLYPNLPPVQSRTGSEDPQDEVIAINQATKQSTVIRHEYRTLPQYLFLACVDRLCPLECLHSLGGLMVLLEG